MRVTAGSVLITAMLAAGCASGGTTGGGGGDRNKITSEQLARVPANNAYEAIRVLQPQWLDSRGANSIGAGAATTAIVFVDGTRGGDLEFLRSVPINTLAEIRFLSPGEASARYGMGLPRGVIELVSKGR
jgi:hypothetical protein